MNAIHPIQQSASYTSTSDVQPARLHPVCVASGDGIGPEVMAAALKVLDAARAPLDITELPLGTRAWQQGITSGISPVSWKTLNRDRVLLKGPMSTPQGGGMKSLNVTLRKSLGLFANVRPVRAYTPYIPSHHPGMDVVIIRENEEDLYAGIEHRQTEDVVQCLKLVSRQGCERVIRYAFEYVRTRGRRRLTCMTKDNIMKLTDGLFHEVFDCIAEEYPDVESDHQIIDIGTARAATSPEEFDVIVTPNLYGDVLSDVMAEVSGSVGMAPSANIGSEAAVFEAIHGTAPDIAGKDIANPSGLILASAKMLAHLGEGETAELIHNAWLRTIEDGVHTADIRQTIAHSRCVGTDEFAGAVIGRLGETPRRLEPNHYPRSPILIPAVKPAQPVEKKLVGVDVFVQSRLTPDALAEQLRKAVGEMPPLTMITNRGVQVWPDGQAQTLCTDHWRCRFKGFANSQLTAGSIIDILLKLSSNGIEFVKTENLYDFDGQPGYSMGQGQ
ncbi:MAG: NADP-dependent isocitrate dehydrogenase [Pseudomonadota bacterium]